MNLSLSPGYGFRAALLVSLIFFGSASFAADKALLDILLGNGAITQSQYEDLMNAAGPTTVACTGASHAGMEIAEVEKIVEQKLASGYDSQVNEALAGEVSSIVQADFPVLADHGGKGFTFKSRDGLWQTNLQWRSQFRFTSPTNGDPRQVDDFESDPESTFEPRRLRMKIGGHGYKPWLGYYFEIDLQPGRDVDADSTRASARVIDWRITMDKWEQLGLRIGQWKIDYNRERVDSSGRQQFVERSIVNRTFTIDRQIGVQFRGRLFKGTPADLNYYAGTYTGQGRGVRNDDNDLMWSGRLQWNFMGRKLGTRQTDVEYTELPTGSLAFAMTEYEGRCTRWSSGGCGNLDGFTKPALAQEGQFRIDQAVQEFAFKWRGFSAQQEYHWKTIKDRVANTENDLTGAYAQAGYFFHHIFPQIPGQLEFAARYAFVEEPNESNRAVDNTRKEYTVGANWFMAGHNNKLTIDFSRLTLKDEFLGRKVDTNRARIQWDISF